VETSSPTNRAAGAQGVQAVHADKSALYTTKQTGVPTNLIIATTTAAGHKAAPLIHLQSTHPGSLMHILQSLGCSY